MDRKDVQAQRLSWSPDDLEFGEETSTKGFHDAWFNEARLPNGEWERGPSLAETVKPGIPGETPMHGKPRNLKPFPEIPSYGHPRNLTPVPRPSMTHGGTGAVMRDDSPERSDFAHLGDPQTVGRWNRLGSGVSERGRTTNPFIGNVTPSAGDYHHALNVQQALRWQGFATIHQRSDVAGVMGQAARHIRDRTPEGYRRGADLLDHAADVAEAGKSPGLGQDVAHQAPAFRELATHLRHSADVKEGKAPKAAAGDNTGTGTAGIIHGGDIPLYNSGSGDSHALVAKGWRDAWMHEPRGPHGQWVHGPGSTAVTDEARGYEGRFASLKDGWIPPLDPPAHDTKALTSAGRPDGTGTAEDPIDVQGNLDHAILLMASGKHVRLNQPDELATLVSKFGQIVDDWGKRMPGAAPPKLDLGLLSVKGTNLFTAQTKGIPRIGMPQLDGDAQPGTRAAELAGGAGKFADLTKQFRQQLEADHIGVTDELVPASHLRATQTQLTGATVAGIAEAYRKGVPAVLTMMREPIYVSRDHYIVDGHHRWAAKMALDAQDGNLDNDTPMEVHKVDMDIGALIPYTNKFAQDWGIAPRALGNAHLVEPPANKSWATAYLTEARAPDGRWVHGAAAIVASAMHEEISDVARNPKSTPEAIEAAYHKLSVVPDDDDRRRLYEHLNRTYVGLTGKDLPGPPAPPSGHQRLALLAAPKVQRLIGSKQQNFNGDVNVFADASDPLTAADMRWDGTMDMAQSVADKLDAESSSTDGPVASPDAYFVLLHELIHSAVGNEDPKDDADAYAGDSPTAAAEEGFTELGAVQHAADFFDAMGIGDRKAAGTDLTLRQVAGNLAEPNTVTAGHAWGHYPWQTAMAQQWTEDVAAREGYYPGTPEYHERLRRLGDEVNQQGAAAKFRVMARQALRANGNRTPSSAEVNEIEAALQGGWFPPRHPDQPVTSPFADVTAQIRTMEAGLVAHG